ncbi:helix-turn-helix DNA binding domain protein [Microbacterium phage Cen1621]|uniref:Helix-turn-helix DNA binding domain protein n=1 Tax=Microbacterium phage Cen1621 TaxID=2965191 RepID=A0A9E7TUR7_9CAUD|nr:helix-turn-helix DNA binding domain protein [Microbacterium phage Cen1621]
MNACQCEGLRCKLEALSSRHGTRTGYAKHGCRCDPCRDAQAAYQRDYAARHPDRIAATAARYYERNREAVLQRNRERIPHLAGTPTRAQRYAAAEKLLQDGSGYREAARTVGVDHGTLADHFPGYGLAPTERGERAQLAMKARAYDQGLDATRAHTSAAPAAELLAAAELLDEGHTVSEVARRTGLAWATINNAIPGHALTPAEASAHAIAAKRDRRLDLAA